MNIILEDFFDDIEIEDTSTQDITIDTDDFYDYKFQINFEIPKNKYSDNCRRIITEQVEYCMSNLSSYHGSEKPVITIKEYTSAYSISFDYNIKPDLSTNDVMRLFNRLVRFKYRVNAILTFKISDKTDEIVYDSLYDFTLNEFQKYPSEYVTLLMFICGDKFSKKAFYKYINYDNDSDRLENNNAIEIYKGKVDMNGLPANILKHMHITGLKDNNIFDFTDHVRDW